MRSSWRESRLGALRRGSGDPLLSLGAWRADGGRGLDTKKPFFFPLHRLARLRVTRRLHHPPSGTSDRARAVGPPRAAPIARLPPVSLISQVLGLVAPHALRNLFGVVQHLLDRPAYLRVTST